jgi:hypothetical protein
MNRQVRDEDERVCGGEQNDAEGTQRGSDWPRYARQLKQRWGLYISYLGLYKWESLGQVE